ncbi:MAG: hypothetical protein EHM58_18295 [Ignavibacteriae bacterium]|nr:MAG: hypothetical protein EHM58_18295 [Ignavibacteriota bacterium]
MKLSNFENAIVQIEKLSNYCLNNEHPRGKHKARVFKARLGLESKDAHFIRDLILNAIEEKDAFFSFKDKFGERYYVDFTIKNENKSAVIRTCWIIKTGETFPRFTSCYIKE